MDDWIKVIIGVAVGAAGPFLAEFVRNRNRIAGEFRQAVSRYCASMFCLIIAYEDRESVAPDRDWGYFIKGQLKDVYVAHAAHYNHCCLEAASAYSIIMRYGSYETIRLLSELETDWGDNAPRPNGPSWATWKTRFFGELERLRDVAKPDSYRMYE